MKFFWHSLQSNLQPWNKRLCTSFWIFVVAAEAWFDVAEHLTIEKKNVVGFIFLELVHVDS